MPFSADDPQRDAVTVSEALAFIGAHPHVFLLARRSDGFPTGYAMMSRVRDGGVEFSTYRSSAKVRNLLREGVAGILAAAEAPGDDRVVFAEGAVSVLDGGVWGNGGGAAAAGASPAVPEAIVETVGARHASGKRCVLRVTIEAARFSRRLG
jgi:hypothetical protein